jgi:TatD DNase family protein
LLLVETHCHLDAEPMVASVPAVLERAHRADVGQIIVPAYDTPSWEQVAVLAARYEEVYPALGLHPWVAAEDLDLVRLREALIACRAVAVGEIGLDYKIDEPEPARQREILTVQIGLARELDLPVILHCRGAFEDMFEILADGGSGLRGVLHAFSKGPELARRGLDLGFHLGFGGAVTRPRARARRTAEVVPLERVVLETDAPSIGLEGIAASEVEPRHVRDVAEALAQIRGLPLADIAAQTTRNARALFKLAELPDES